jgi:transcriptional regulator with XRE-family HTH domain
MNLVDRFRYVMKVYNETPSSFADKIGVQRSSISHILSERNKPSLDFIQKILEHYPKVDAQWLINGKQSSQTQQSPEVEINQVDKEVKKPVVRTEESDGIEKPRIDEVNLKVNSEIKSNTSTASKKVDRIIVFYTDNTFETFNSAH